MKLSIVVPYLNQRELTKACLFVLQKNTFGYGTLDAMQEGDGVELVLIDNGSSEKLGTEELLNLVATITPPFGSLRYVRNEKSTGVYDTFRQGFEIAKGDVVAFFHSDFVVWEKNWDQRVLGAFMSDPQLGMVGFIGSSEIDNAGGRGLGTTSNFMGRTLSWKTPITGEEHRWTGSPAEPHGARGTGLTKAAVLDGCSMIIRRMAWNDIGYRPDYLFHHFYDKIISAQMLEKSWGIAVLGIECDHFSGQTVNQEGKYREAAVEWGLAHGIPDITYDNADQKVYLDSEGKFLREYRDEKHIIPVRV